MKARIVIFAMILMGVLVSSAFAQVPQLINYQGVLTDPTTGNPVTDGTYSITFSIYSVASGGAALWTETQNVTTTSGRFNVLLGSVNPIAYTVFSGGDRYLGVKVGTDAEMTPRKRMVSVGYAFMANEADKVDGQDATAFAPATHNHDGRYYTESELNTSDGNPPNTGSNRVSWDNLKDVPAGFADGTDDTGGGAITSVDSLNGGTIHSTLNVEGDIRTGSGAPSITSSGSDDVESTDDVTADDDIRAGGDMIAQGHLWSVNSHVVAENGHIRTGATQPGYVGAGDIYAADDVIAGGSIETGTPSSSFGNGDIASTDELVADTHVRAGGNVNSSGGHITTGTPSAPGGLSSGDIASTDDVLADDIVRAGRYVAAGLPSKSHGTGDVAADDDLVADGNVEVNGDALIGDDIVADYISANRGSGSAMRARYYILAGYIGGISIPQGITTGDLVAEDDVLAHDDILGYGTKSAVLQTASYGSRRMYADESTEVYFFDRGQGQLINGEVTINLDPIFVEMVNIAPDNPMLVQITLTGDCKGVYVARQTATSFTVKELMAGTSNATFNWEVAARRRGYERIRIEKIEAVGMTVTPAAEVIEQKVKIETKAEIAND